MRIEHDTMGSVSIPRLAYYGPQTQRAVDNFPISGKPIPAELIHALGLVKQVSAMVNNDLGLFQTSRPALDREQVECIIDAAREVATGRWDQEFPIDVFQTGSGTSSNMNANEVISNRAIELSGGDRFSPMKTIHPNDHINLGQSSNDVFPTAIHVAVAVAIQSNLIPALTEAAAILKRKSILWQNIIKIGRTHWADATPISLGQEIGGMAALLESAKNRAEESIRMILELPIGGTAVGSGLNTHPQFGTQVAESLAIHTGIAFKKANNAFEANSQRDGLVAAHALLKSVAVTLFHLANNIRILGSGPRCGFFELILPDLQPGSSIMPGKVNPVLCESLMQVAAKVIGNDQTISMGGATGGQFQLNVMMPLMADVSLESIRLMTEATKLFAQKCLIEMEPNEQRCLESVEKSLAMVTALNPYIGYEKAAELAKEAFKTGKTIREICLEQQVLSPRELAEALDPQTMSKAASS